MTTPVNLCIGYMTNSTVHRYNVKRLTAAWEGVGGRGGGGGGGGGGE